MGQHDAAIQLLRPCRTDRRSGPVRTLDRLLHRSRRRQRRYLLRLWKTPIQKPSALTQRLRVRDDRPDFFQLDAIERNQRVTDRHHHLMRDPKSGLVDQQVVRGAHCPLDRVLDRQNRDIRQSSLDRFGQRRNAGEPDHRGVCARVDDRRFLAVGASWSQKRYRHRVFLNQSDVNSSSA